MNGDVVGDVRDEILRKVAGTRLTACIIADDDGIVVETARVVAEAARLGLGLARIVGDGTTIEAGQEIARFSGTPKQVAMAEEVLIGLLAKASGIATAAHRFVDKAGDRPRIVSGAWKKMPPAEKDSIRRAIVAGGAFYRVTHEPLVYLDKTYIQILGGIKESLQAVAHLAGYTKVVQIKGRYNDIDAEAVEGVRYGADIIFVDTGRYEDAARVSKELRRLGLRDRVRLAFGGNVRLEDLDLLRTTDSDILDVGRPIVDAPLLDMRLEVVDAEEG
jgi:nicotinate-nucleotide pyrophosphorylase (carboxylating)